MFIRRVSETSRFSFFAQYRSILCMVAVAAFAICFSPKALAQTYTAGSVVCTTITPEGYASQSVSDDLLYSIDNGSRAEEQCVWSDFAPSGTKFGTASSLNLYVDANLTDPWGNPVTEPGDLARVFTSPNIASFQFNAGNPQGEVDTSYPIAAEIDLSTVSVEARTFAGDGQGSRTELDFYEITITH